MRCIFCLEERTASEEHVFPLAVGGVLTTDRVCDYCNSWLGRKVDTGLTEFEPIVWTRGELEIAGHSGKPPSRYNMLDGVATLADEPNQRVKIKYNQKFHRLDIKALHYQQVVELPNGNRVINIVVDETEKSTIPKIIQRARKRFGMEPLTNVELDRLISKLELKTIERPTLNISKSFDFTFLPHSLLKIAYELAFLWLGESYLDDPYAERFRKALLDANAKSMNSIEGYAGLIPEKSAFSLWEPNRKHHLAYAINIENKILIGLRIFDSVEAIFPVTENAMVYLKNDSLRLSLPFLAMNSVSGAMYQTSFIQETKRLDNMLRIFLKDPPFPDPLAVDQAVSLHIKVLGFSCQHISWDWGWVWPIHDQSKV